MKNIAIQLVTVAAVALAPAAAFAGKGGSAAAIQSAVRSRSVDAIIAEVERAEALACEACIEIVTGLTEDSRYEVREVAAWWFAKRPALRDMLVGQFTAELPGGSTVQVRNAADFLGSTRTFRALPQLAAAMQRGDLGAEAKLALVRAAGAMAHPNGNALLVTGMSDANASVRAAAVTQWREILGQRSAEPVLARLTDGDADVRAQAATVVGALKAAGGRAALESLVASDPDSVVRRNAAWALGQLGNAGSRGALERAAADPSGLVRGVARASLALLR